MQPFFSLLSTTVNKRACMLSHASCILPLRVHVGCLLPRYRVAVQQNLSADRSICRPLPPKARIDTPSTPGTPSCVGERKTCNGPGLAAVCCVLRHVD